MFEQGLVFAVLLAALVLFVWGKWRYDLVAAMALLVLAVAGIVPTDEVFSGFAHPAVITVAAVLVISRGLMNSGAVDMISRLMAKVGQGQTAQVAALTGLVAVCSAFMNNVGALALLMPVAIGMARSAGRSPSTLLMPLAFGSLLGGLITLIGTPPNIIIATYRTETGSGPFRMFDFAPVGAGVALAGVAFIALGGWRLIPQRQSKGSRAELFQVEDYIAEVSLPEGCKLIGESVRALEEAVEGEIIVAGLVRNERRLPAPSRFEFLRQGDILTVEADAETLKELVDQTGAELVGSYEFSEEDLKSDDVAIVEAVVAPDAPSAGRTVSMLGAGWRYGINVLAVSRHGKRLTERLSRTRLRPGDVLLMQAREDSLQEALSAMGLLPLAERGLRIGKPRKLLLAVALFAAALAVAALGILPVQIALFAAAVAMLLVGMMSLKEAYDGMDWPVIVLLAAMIPVGGALESTGAAGRIADLALAVSSQFPPVVALVLLIIATMFLSDVINNAAAAVLMAPIAIRIAAGLEASADPFLMGVALGASCAFLTPIGHQSNTLVMGPGGYRFGDYWRLGLPLEVIIVAVGVPLIMVVWPMFPG